MRRKILLAVSFAVVLLAFSMKPAVVTAGSYEEKLEPMWMRTAPDVSDCAVPAMIENSDVLLQNCAAAKSFTSETELVKYLRGQMVLRKNSVPVTLQTKKKYTGGNVFLQMFYDAQEETGKPDEGDYLRYHVAGVTFPAINVEYKNGVYTYHIEFKPSYYSNLKQEKAVTAEAARILEELGIADMKSDYQKIRAIHGYLAEHVTYDYKDLNDSGNVLKYTAYDALIQHTSVCQGYASSLYRLLMEAGIPVRIVIGTSRNQNHAWNIVQLRGKWYFMDSTWESGNVAAGGSFKYLLRGSKGFKEHTLTKDFYYTDSFYASYPVSASDYKVTEKDKYDAADFQVSLSEKTFLYNGKARKPKIQIKGMREGIDYTVKYTYKNNVEPGTAVLSAQITGKGSCKGSCKYTTEYSIVLGKPTVKLERTSSGLKVSWKKIIGAEGYQIQYGKKSDFSDSKTVKIKGNQSISGKLNGLNGGTAYYVRVRSYKKVNGKNVYSDWSDAKVKKV